MSHLTPNITKLLHITTIYGTERVKKQVIWYDKEINSQIQNMEYSKGQMILFLLKQWGGPVIDLDNQIKCTAWALFGSLTEQTNCKKDIF